MTTFICALATHAAGHTDLSNIAAMAEIYHHHVHRGTASFEIDPPSIGDLESWMMAVIGVSANAASIRPHGALGLGHIGTAQKIGLKFGHRLDIEYMEQALKGCPDNNQCVQAPLRVNAKLSA